MELCARKHCDTGLLRTILQAVSARPPADYLKPELVAETQPKPDFTDFLDKVRRGQAAVGKEHAVPIVLGARCVLFRHGILATSARSTRCPSCWVLAVFCSDFAYLQHALVSLLASRRSMVVGPCCTVQDQGTIWDCGVMCMVWWMHSNRDRRLRSTFNKGLCAHFQAPTRWWGWPRWRRVSTARSWWRVSSPPTWTCSSS